MNPFDFPYVRAALLRDPEIIHDINRSNDRERERSNVEGVSRHYEETFLIEPNVKKGERHCVRGDQCECLQIPCNNPFIGKEFFLPSELERVKATGEIPSIRNRCLLCTRADIARALLNIRSDGKGMKRDNVLSNYFNLR